MFRSVWHAEAAAAARQRQRGHETVAPSFLEMALNPSVPAGDATASLHQQFKIAEWRLMRVVEWHFATPVPDSVVTP